MLTVALFINNRNWKQFKYLFTDEWINKTWYGILTKWNII